MAFAMQHLLRLPPPLRCQILNNASFLARSLETHQSQLRFTLRKSYAQAKAPPKPRRKAAPFGPRDAAPRPAPPQRPFQSTGNPYADRLCHNSDIVLLYNSPKHTSFFITAYICGVLFFVAGFNTAITIKESNPKSPNDGGSKPTTRTPMPWYIRYSFVFGAIGFAAMGTMFILAPTKMIQRIWLLKPQPQQAHSSTPLGASRPGYTFKIETQSPLLFRKGRTIETLTSNVSLDRVIRAQQDDLTWHSVPLDHSKAFTNHYLHRLDPSVPSPSLPPQSSRTIISRLRALNASLLSVWPTLRGHARRMFLRDSIAYVHIIGESGQWKLDLKDCEVLDRGRSIEKLFREEDKSVARKGVIPFLQGLMGSGGGKGM